MPALISKLATAGMGPALAYAFGNDTADNLIAAGTNQATAYQTSTAVARFTTVAAGTGCLLSQANQGDSQIIYNAGANSLSIYPPSGHNINGGSANAAYTLNAGSWGYFDRISNTAWLASSDDAANQSFTPSGTRGTSSPSTVAGMLERSLSLLPMNGLVFYDTFSRPDTSLGSLGTSESGHTWDLRGVYAGSYPLPAATEGQISGGMFVSSVSVASDAIYATQTFANTMTRIGCKASWTASTGVTGSTVAMLISLDNKFIDTMLHFTINRATWALQKRISGGSFTNILTGTFSPVLANDGTIYTFELTVNGCTATVNLNGFKSSAFDTDIPNIIGPYCVWEQFYNTDPSQDTPRHHAVWAGAALDDQYIGNAKHTANGSLTEFQSATTLSVLSGALNCVGTTAVESTITASAGSGATGGFKRTRIRLFDASSNGWLAESVNDASPLPLRWQSVVTGTGTDVLRFYPQGLAYSKIQNSITAHAGGGQGSATALTGQICRVTTVATGGDSVVLPASLGFGLAVLVVNDGANSCNVFPASGGAIDAAGTNNAVAVAAGGRTWFIDVASNVWISK